MPFQDVEAAITELRRAVTELGMLGGMLPSNGEAIQGHWAINFTGRFTKKRKSSAALWPSTSAACTTWDWIPSHLLSRPRSWPSV